MSDGAAPASDHDPVALYEDAACGLLVTADDGLIRRVNRTFCRWTGYDPQDLVGRIRLQDLLTMGGRIFHQTHWSPLLQIQGSLSEVKLEIVHRDGRRIPTVLNAIRRLYGTTPVHELAVFIAEDRHKYEKELLQARHRAEELLAKEQQAQQALSVAQAERDRQQAMAEDRALFAEQMMAIVSHDLRNPLSVIKMSAYLIGMGELSSNQLGALGRLGTSTARASRLIADLLDFSQARLGGGLKVDPQPIDLHSVVHESVDDLRLAFPAHRIVHLRTGTGACLASSDRLVQLIGNLVGNAATYGQADLPITVTSAIQADAFRIEVHNEGVPIAAELRSRMFDPMTRGTVTQDGQRSVGLGLFIVREIARAHGGDVAVESSEAAGTSFVVTVPRQADQGLFTQ